MNPQDDKTIAFFGRMTANLTHEIKNILAIIQESAGLMEDINAISPPADSRYQDKFTNALQSIKTQLHRGMELTTRFNRFAHSPDHSRAELDLADAVEQLRSLAERFARLKYIQLTIDRDVSGARVRVVTNPVKLYMALFFGIESCLSVLPANCRIALTPSLHEQTPAVGIHCGGDDLGQTPDAFTHQLYHCPSWSELTEVMDQLDGTIQPDDQACGFRLLFGSF